MSTKKERLKALKKELNASTVIGDYKKRLANIKEPRYTRHNAYYNLIQDEVKRIITLLYKYRIRQRSVPFSYFNNFEFDFFRAWN